MTTAQATAAPATTGVWASYVGFGFLVAGVGALVFGFGMFTGSPAVDGAGAGITSVGAALSLFGGCGYFLSR